MSEKLCRRYSELTYGVDLKSHRGLEFGALDNPVIQKSGADIRYVDYAGREQLRAHPHAASISKDKIVNVDYVWAGSGSLAAVVGNAECFDYAIASHVIEHVPNIIGWWQGIAEVLRPGGVLNLAVPDKRYTFDVRRPVSTLGALVEAYLLEYRYPSIRQEFDHCFGIAAIEPGAIWTQNVDVGALPSYSGDLALQLAFDQAKDILANGRYYDSHCWVFTPSSFLSLLDGASTLDLVPYVLEKFEPTQPGDFEFYASLRKSRTDEPRDTLQVAKRNAISQARDQLVAKQREARLLAEC